MATVRMLVLALLAVCSSQQNSGTSGPSLLDTVSASSPADDVISVQPTPSVSNPSSSTSLATSHFSGAAEMSQEGDAIIATTLSGSSVAAALVTSTAQTLSSSSGGQTQRSTDRLQGDMHIVGTTDWDLSPSYSGAVEATMETRVAVSTGRATPASQQTSSPSLDDFATPTLSSSAQFSPTAPSASRDDVLATARLESVASSAPFTTSPLLASTSETSSYALDRSHVTSSEIQVVDRTLVPTLESTVSYRGAEGSVTEVQTSEIRSPILSSSTSMDAVHLTESATVAPTSAVLHSSTEGAGEWADVSHTVSSLSSSTSSTTSTYESDTTAAVTTPYLTSTALGSSSSIAVVETSSSSSFSSTPSLSPTDSSSSFSSSPVSPLLTSSLHPTSVTETIHLPSASLSTSSANQTTAVPTTPRTTKTSSHPKTFPPTTHKTSSPKPHTENVRYMLTFRGDCRLILNNTEFFRRFLTGLHDLVVKVMQVPRGSYTLGDVSCGSVRVFVTFHDVTMPEFDILMQSIIRQGGPDLSVPVWIDSHFNTYDLYQIKHVPLKPDSHTYTLVSEVMDDVDIIVIIVACCVCGVLIAIGVAICAKECYRRKHEHSFNLLEVPHVSLKLEDFTLTRIPRPRTRRAPAVPAKKSHAHHQQYHLEAADIVGAGPEGAGGVAKSGVGAGHPSITAGAINGHAHRASDGSGLVQPTDMHLRVQQHSDGIIVGVTASAFFPGARDGGGDNLHAAQRGFCLAGRPNAADPSQAARGGDQYPEDEEEEEDEQRQANERLLGNRLQGDPDGVTNPIFVDDTGEEVHGVGGII